MGSASGTDMHNIFGAYVRSQRQLARLTLRQAAEMASISNPYLSQIEHGLARPSIAVISALAEALSVSAETLLLRAAGIGSPDAAEPLRHTEEAIRQDPRLDEGQRRALLAVLASYVGPPSESAPPQSVRSGPRRVRPQRTSGRPAVAGASALNQEGHDHG